MLPFGRKMKGLPRNGFGGERRKPGDTWIVQAFAIRSDGGQGPCVFDDTFAEAHGASDVQPLCRCRLIQTYMRRRGCKTHMASNVKRSHLSWPSHPGVPTFFFFFFLSVLLRWGDRCTHTCPGRHTGANILVPRCGLTIPICTESLSMSLPSELTRITWVTQDEAKRHLHSLIMITVLIVL